MERVLVMEPDVQHPWSTFLVSADLQRIHRRPSPSPNPHKAASSAILEP